MESEGLSEGARLPAERELAHQLGVSRPSLREALIALEIDGRIEIRSGSGIFVRASSRRSEVYTGSMGESPGELLQARVVLETAVATLAAARVSKRGLQRVEEALQDMKDGLAKGYKPVDADRRFHLGIAELGGNPVLVGMISTLFDGRHSPIALRMSVRVETVHSWQSALAEHEAILRALRSRNPQAAASAMCHHLQTSHGRLIGEPADFDVGAALV
jgi:DNA-binding FadR family transcriptional regulator